MARRCIIALLIIILLPLLPPVHAQETSPAERDFIIETIPGNTALVVDANKEETVYRPGGSIIDRIQKYVSISAFLAKNKDNKDVINITSFDKQSLLYNALPALLPKAIQERIRYPQDHLEGNELFPTIAGRACSDFKETDPEGKPLKTAIKGNTFKPDFYRLVSFATVFSAITGAIRYEENGRQKNGLTGLNLLTPRQEITVTQNNQHILTNPNILYPCGIESRGRRVPQKELEASGSLAPGDTLQEKLNVTASVPQEKLGLAQHIKQLFDAGKCTAECRELAMALATNATLTIVAPGYVALAGLTYDTKGDLAANLEKENPLAYKRFTSYKGWTNAFRPAKLTFAGSITQEDGTTGQQIIGRAETSSVQETQSLQNIPWRGSRGVIKATDIVTDCMLMPKKLQKDRGSLCNQQVIPPDSLGKLTYAQLQYAQDRNNNPLTYDTPYRNTLCSVTSGIIADAQAVMSRWYPSYAAVGTQNLGRMWEEVQRESIKAGWNPAYVLALWIEESAAGGAKNAYGMGCIYHTYANGAGKTTPGGNDDATREQYQCLFERSFDEDFNRLMCTYSGEERDEFGHCTNFANNPNFIHNVRYWYDFLAQDLPPSCQSAENSGAQ